MLNIKALEYIDYSLGDRVNNKFVYGGIYKDDILLIEMDEYQESFIEYVYDILKPNYSYMLSILIPMFKINKSIPTFNELKYIINSYNNRLLTLLNLPYGELNICEFLHVDNIYYRPYTIRYVIRIKRIPLKLSR